MLRFGKNLPVSSNGKQRIFPTRYIDYNYYYVTNVYLLYTLKSVNLWSWTLNNKIGLRANQSAVLVRG